MKTSEVQWLVQRAEDDSELIRTLTKRNQPHKTMASATLMFDSAVQVAFDPNKPVVFRGSLEKAASVQRHSMYYPGVYMDLPKLECTYYYARLGKYLLNYDYMMLPYGELLRREDELYFSYGGCYDTIFIRPSSGFKLFSGQLLEKRYFQKDVPRLGFYDIEPEKMVIVSSAKSIDEEYRVVIGKGKTITGSLYKVKDKLNIDSYVPTEIFDYCNKVAAEWEGPDSVYVMDIGTFCDEPYLLELNSFACSGLYACDMDKIIERVNEIVIEDWNNVSDS